MSSEMLHEEELSDGSRDLHRAIVSLMEELEAVDWYQQRVEASADPELAAILAHNRDEEIEHASMVLEWLRRKHPKFEEHLKTYLFTSGSITDIEGASSGSGSGSGAGADASLGVGSLR
jgi:ferritin-like protein